MTRTICGVDVSKRDLEAHVEPGGAAGRFANTDEGIAQLAEFCRGHGVELALMEATGGLEEATFLGLWSAGVAAARVNPRFVRRFAEAFGTLEKTDRIDAAIIARFGLAGAIAPQPPAGRNQRRINALVARLSQITRDITTNKQRLSAARDAETRDSLGEVLALLKRQARTIEGEIGSLIDDDPLWAHLNAALRRVKGVAGRTIARLLAELPEIGQVSNKAIAKLAGLAPIANDSGKRAGPRSIRGGRGGVRSTLFLVAAIAAKYDPHLAAFKDRLTQAGKPKMVVRIALARKLLVILNAKARDARAEHATAT